MSLVFYDTETTGTNAAFDQILQFAAIKTDEDLKEVGRFELRSRLLPYLLPSPGALRVTGLTIDDLLNEAHPTHYDMVCGVRSALEGWCPAVFVGYNSISFDEEFLRQAFYQCLHPPYLTNTSGSKRADALTLVRTAVALYPDCISVPLNEKGRRVFKLDQLAPANGFDHANAHDALADVEATIFLCGLVKERCPDVWKRFLQFASKEAVSSFVYSADAFFLIDPLKQATKAVVALGDHPAQSNLTYCWDLKIDPGPYSEMTDADLARELAKPGSPVRKLKKNAAPSLCPLDEAPPDIVPDVERETLMKRGRWVRRDQAFVQRAIEAMSSNETEYPRSPHVERQIYDGFWSAADNRRLAAFHAADWPGRARIANEFEDERLAWLGRRLVWVAQPNLCLEPHATNFARQKARRLLAEGDDCGGWNTIGKVADELAKIMESSQPENIDPLLRLRDYINERKADCEGTLRDGA